MQSLETRKLRFTFEDGTQVDFEIARVTAIRAKIPTVFSLEELKGDENKYRLTYSAAALPDLINLEKVEIIRTD